MTWVFTNQPLTFWRSSHMWIGMISPLVPDPWASNIPSTVHMAAQSVFPNASSCLSLMTTCSDVWIDRRNDVNWMRWCIETMYLTINIYTVKVNGLPRSSSRSISNHLGVKIIIIKYAYLQYYYFVNTSYRAITISPYITISALLSRKEKIFSRGVPSMPPRTSGSKEWQINCAIILPITWVPTIQGRQALNRLSRCLWEDNAAGEVKNKINTWNIRFEVKQEQGPIMRSPPNDGMGPRLKRSVGAKTTAYRNETETCCCLPKNFG